MEVTTHHAGLSIDAPPAASSNGSWSLPTELECPLTHELMLDPVLASDGATYERSAIAEWLGKQSTSPLTGEPLDEATLRPNVMVRNITLRLLHAEEQRVRSSLGQRTSR